MKLALLNHFLTYGILQELIKTEAAVGKIRNLNSHSRSAAAERISLI